MNPIQTHYKTLASTVIKNLEKRQMEGYYFATAKEAVEKALSLLPNGAVVSYGGSMTVADTGILDTLRADASITLLDRDNVKYAAEKEEIFRAAMQLP